MDDPDLGTWIYEYDVAGNLINQTDNKGNQILMSYDSLNRIKQKNSTSTNITFSYDAQYQGTLTNVSYINLSLSYTYDKRLRVIQERLNALNESFVTGMTYDSSDRILEQLLPDGEGLDYYYNLQGKLHRINGYINQTEYNAFGNPLNRTYFNDKVTEYSYYPDNARLKQIRTDSSQILNYSYDNVGNVLEINDQANNRLYSMSYDNLDRLTNVSIGAFKWVYSYDAIGNILKIVRNHSVTTAFKYEGNAHFPTIVIDFNTSVDVYREQNMNNSNKTKIFTFFLINEKNSSLQNVGWSAKFDENTINSTQDFNLSKAQNVLVIVEHNYSKGGNYRINFTSKTASELRDYEILNLLFGAEAQSLSVLNQNATNIVTEFNVKNSINELSTGWEWECNNGVTSSVPFNMSANQELLVIMEHNYSISNRTLNCIVNSTDGNQSLSLPLTYDGLEITSYNSTKIDDDSVNVKFTAENHFNPEAVSWTITTSENTYTGGPTTLNQGQTLDVSQQVDFNRGGLKAITLNVNSGNFSASYIEYYYVNWLSINDFYKTVKNATARVFDFFVTNENAKNTDSIFNTTQPIFGGNATLGENKSILVIIEEDYSQGSKQHTVKVYNSTNLENSLTDIFVIKQIEISEFETLSESDKSTVSAAVIKNNIAPLNISWQLNNSQDLISSVNNTELSTGQEAIVIIESSYSSSGIYPLKLTVNSSTYQDNETGVAVS